MKHMLSFQIDVPEPFRFSENLNYLSRSPNECLYQIRSDRIYRALPVQGSAVVMDVGADADGQAIAVRLLGDPDSPVDQLQLQAQAEAYVREWFDLDTDLAPFYEQTEADPLLGKAIKAFYGLRLIGIPDLFEAISWGIIGQQIHLGYAYTLKRRLVEAYGHSVEHEGNTYWLFPKAEDIARLEVQDLQPLRMTVKKCEYLIHTARLIADGSLTKLQLMNAGSLKLAEKRLVSIRGIGPWTAHYVLMRCLRMPDAFPIDDVGLHNAIRHLQGMDRKPTKAEIMELSSRWSGWEAYATFYLWRYLY
ncbi:DNA-3-methyladenine glycosylase [Paenibacillus cisolokensis]|uniref:DNA-3-methyladenine glycosylase family protein n=1 Tax=Paenibacillus cisolokensis TaxID=1658519 RepID=UPI003D267B23